MSLKQTILDYLQAEYPRVVHKGEIGRKAVLEWGYENENAGRRCRELENEGRIIKLPNKKGEAQYQWNTSPSTATFPAQPFNPVMPQNLTKTIGLCCYSYQKFQVHDSNCEVKKRVEITKTTQTSPAQATLL